MFKGLCQCLLEFGLFSLAEEKLLVLYCFLYSSSRLRDVARVSAMFKEMSNVGRAHPERLFWAWACLSSELPWPKVFAVSHMESQARDPEESISCSSPMWGMLLGSVGGHRGWCSQASLWESFPSRSLTCVPSLSGLEAQP